MKIPLRVGLPVLGILALAIFSGCTGTVPSEPTGGIVSISEAKEPFRPITLQEGLEEVEKVFVLEEQSISPLHIHYIQGRGLSSEGKAEQWIFGVKHEKDNYFVVVESNHTVLLPIENALPEKEIHLSEIISPAALITNNSEVISTDFDVPESSFLVGIELIENIYAVTPDRATVYHILYFNATTGREIGR